MTAAASHASDPAAGPGPDGEEAADHASRRARAVEALDDLDALLVTRAPNVRWLTGFAGSSGALLLHRDGRAVLATDGRYAERAAATGLEVALDRSDDWLDEAIAGVHRLGVEAHGLTWERARRLADQWSTAAVEPAGRLVEGLRLRKDASEIAALRRACAITAQVLGELLPALEPGESERSVAARVEHALRAHGAEDRAFPTIVASGPNGAHPHHEPGDRVLAEGDFVTVDAGARVAGYHADMTRTVAIGEPPRRLRTAYEAVRAAQAAGVEAARAGAVPGEVDAAARAVLARHELAEACVHPTGHGVGLEVHEPPILRAAQPEARRDVPAGESVPEGGSVPTGAREGKLPDPFATLLAWSTITVEPGVYLPGLGESESRTRCWSALTAPRSSPP
ncbi:aminopeptidase P family protein [Egibacter rhizosphaerae]|uniref:Aminopeptidase P family protein n=1 Tax=Egibacter rhizosphaerae TaxID=1670831 RepID=A0A411YK22_9ACTN|nr:Xaa-Pro peptidase family protein [Egibacter rhizosphaerae]QBI21531.1 aminopeptidase P family protein [Egibacter rhizosphaerae]